jgi:hypothetical protein
VKNPRNDKALSHIYREGAWPEPNRQIEHAIRATERERRSFARRWALPFVLAAGGLLAFALIFRSEQPRPAGGSPPPASGAKLDQSAATPDTQETRAKLEEQKAAVKPDAQKAGAKLEERKAAVKPDAQKASVKPQNAPASARAPAPPSLVVTPPYAMRKDEAERRGLLPPDVGLKPGSPASESPLPPLAPKSGLQKELTERERTPDPPAFAPTRPPQAWIEDIRKLKAEGKAEEAALALAEFRKRYADFVLPEDLR